MENGKPAVVEALQYGPYTAPTLEMALFLSDINTITLADDSQYIRPGDWVVKLSDHEAAVFV